MNEIEKAKFDDAIAEIPTFDENSIKHTSCSNCNKRLLDIIKNENVFSSKMTILKIQCPFCNDYSFNQTIEGEFWLGNTDNVNYTEIEFKDMQLDENKKIKNCMAIISTRKV